jgi:phosphate transport system ATP-binding protein
MIHYRNVTVSGGGVKIIDDLDLELPDKGTAVILGPSGCGKTTLLRTTIRDDEEDPDLEFSGTIAFHGRNVRESGFALTQLRQRVGLIMQRPVAFPGSTLDNVTFALKCTTDLSPEAIDRRARHALEEVGLEPEHYSTAARNLSGGQLRRLSIARTIALEPEVLLMDEPSAGLDPLSVAQLERLIVTLAESRLVVVVTHDVGLARRIADSVFFLWPYPGGCKLVESGMAVDVLDSPKRLETRLFVETARHGAKAMQDNGVGLSDVEAEECCAPRRIAVVDAPPDLTELN